MLKDNLLTLMDKVGINGLQLAKKSGVPQARISDIVTGKTANPRMETLKKLALALEVTVAELTGEIVAEDGPQYPKGRQLTPTEQEILDLVQKYPETQESIAHFFSLSASQRLLHMSRIEKDFEERQRRETETGGRLIPEPDKDH